MAQGKDLLQYVRRGSKEIGGCPPKPGSGVDLMARARILKPGFFANELLADINPYGRLLFAGLWTLADREGTL